MILFICAGGVFFLMFGWFLVVTFEERKITRNRAESIEEYYNGKNLAHIEYDLAYYDDSTLKLLKDSAVSQVSMDDLTGDKDAEVLAKKIDEAIVTRVEASGIKQITGNYRP